MQVHLKEFMEKPDKENAVKLLWISIYYMTSINIIVEGKSDLSLFREVRHHGTSKGHVGVDDEIRARIKEVKALLMEEELDKEIISSKIDEMIYEINEMIYKEESILFPMTLDHLTQDEWITIAEESEEIGYCLTGPAEKWKPERVALEEDSLADGQRDTGNVKFETGFCPPRRSMESLATFRWILPLWIRITL